MPPARNGCPRWTTTSTCCSVQVFDTPNPGPLGLPEITGRVTQKAHHMRFQMKTLLKKNACLLCREFGCKGFLFFFNFFFFLSRILASRTRESFFFFNITKFDGWLELLRQVLLSFVSMPFLYGQLALRHWLPLYLVPVWGLPIFCSYIPRRQTLKLLCNGCT